MIRVTAPRLEALPGTRPWWRLSAQLVVEEGPKPGRDSLWIEGPGPADGVDATGTPWAVLLSPLAAHLSVPLNVEAPVDDRVASGIRAVSERWSGWYADVEPVRLEASMTPGDDPSATPMSDRDPSADVVVPDGTERTAAFFTGGVDSLWTALEHRDTGAASRDLICVHGFDIPLSGREAFDRMTDRFGGWARGWGGDVIPLRTNLRETRAEAAPWGPLAHGCALIGVGLSLGPRYDVLRIAATGGRRDPHPWGSHLLTDPLLGTTRTRIDHHGADATRWEKTRRIADDPDALRLLRVCWRSGTDRNCGACSKCLRSMALLELFGALDRAPTFPDRLPVDALARVHVEESWDFREFTDLVAVARREGRADVAAAAARAMRRSRWRRRALTMLDRLAGTPALGVPARSWRARLRAGSIA